MTPAEVAAAAQLACLLEASAAKPGNVSPGRSFRDTRYEDFLASAVAIGPAFLAIDERPLGSTILDALRATRRWTQVNTNLGMVLLLAPLARAAMERRSNEPLRAAVQRVIEKTTVDDAEDVYEAIRLAGAGGLGSVPEQDVARPPTVTLREAMQLAANRDAIANEYVTSFARTFGVGVPAIARALGDDLAWNDAVVEGFLALLADAPDSLIARKLGLEAATTVRDSALALVRGGQLRTDAGKRLIERLDAMLRDPENRMNPGATADLTAAAVFVVIIERGFRV